MFSVVPWWQHEDEVRHDLNRYSNGCIGLLAVAEEFQNGTVTVNGHNAAFEEFTRATKTFAATIKLACEGFGQQANMLAATLFESSMVVCWAVKNPVDANKLAELHATYGIDLHHERLRHAGLAGGDQEEALSPEDRSLAEQTYGHDSTGLWTGHSSLQDLVAAVSNEWDNPNHRERLQKIWLNVAHHWALSMKSSTGLANKSHRAKFPDASLADDGAMLLSPEPGPTQVVQALELACASFTFALDSIAESIAPHLEEKVKNAYGLAWLASKKPEQLKGLKDDSPCPCDAPGTLWGDCHKWTSELGSVDHEGLISCDEFEVVPLPKEAGSIPASEVVPDKDIIFEQNEEKDEPPGPLVYTFTCRLPFSLGLTDTGRNIFYFDDNYVNDADKSIFGVKPYVVVRLHNVAVDGFEIWPEMIHHALRHFYDHEAPQNLSKAGWGQGFETYEQWVSIETPSGRLKSEDEDDQAYAFHRCLRALNVFLTAHSLSSKNLSIYPVSTQDLRPIVFRGAYTNTGEWVDLGCLLMHPEALPYSAPAAEMETQTELISLATNELRDSRPFLSSKMWHNRAMRAAQFRGDYADCIVSLQTSTEIMVFDLWRMMLIDRGKTASEINTTIEGIEGFKSVIVRILAGFLGGCWDIQQDSRPVGKYWKQVYEIRNRIIHRGYEPGATEVGAALKAYEELREYINELLWRKRKQYPKTILTKLGIDGLKRHGWSDKTIEKLAVKSAQQGRRIWWPQR